jgi:hypothetical protein
MQAVFERSDTKSDAAICPACNAVLSCWPVWEFADRNHIIIACSRHDGSLWFFRPRLADGCAIPSFDRLRPPTPLARFGLRRGCDRSFVILLLDQQRPYGACHLVGERDRHQHARLSRQHALKP